MAESTRADYEMPRRTKAATSRLLNRTSLPIRTIGRVHGPLRGRDRHREVFRGRNRREGVFLSPRLRKPHGRNRHGRALSASRFWRLFRGAEYPISHETKRDGKRIRRLRAIETIPGGRATDADVLHQITLRQIRLAPRKYGLIKGRGNGYALVGNILEPLSDDAHFVVGSPGISLQISLRLLEPGLLALTFPSPRVVTAETSPAFIELANALNVASVRAGTLAVDSLDFCCQALAPSSLLHADPKQARKTLLDDGVRIFESISSPIYGLARARWPAEKAVGFVEQLYRDGYVYDDDYF